MSLLLSRMASRLRAVTCLMPSAACLAGILATSPAFATDGYFQNGIGARSKALAGAGAADSTDATAASLNPAGLTNVESQVNLSVSAFKLNGGYSSSSSVPLPAFSGFDADGYHASETGWAAIPNLAATWRVNWGLIDAVALSVYGNGGVNSHYKDIPNANCVFAGPGSSGVFCRGPLGMKLSQSFYSVAFAKEVMPGVSVGVAPIVARQTGKVDGVSLFAGNSSDPAHFSNMGIDSSWGAGVRGGVEWKVAPHVRLGLTGNTRLEMSNFDKYRGLLAGQGGFDIPASLQVGVAFDAMKNLTFMADYKRIWFGSVASVGNPSILTTPFGSTGGPGFGVRDVDVIKLGVEWRQSPQLTLRAGYSHNTAPIASRDADLNILSLGVVQDHVTGGLKYQLTRNLDLELSAMYAPRASVRGTELGAPMRAVEIEASQVEFTAGVTYRFGDRPAGRSAEPLK
jgi:long-chain fatty acid transport protein